MKKKIDHYIVNHYEFIDMLRKYNNIYIQTHDFPDHDAVASAWALQNLLSNFEINSKLVYEGVIQRDSLKHFIKDLNIDIKHIGHYKMDIDDKIIIVDGCKGNKNVTDLIGDEIGVIDHHIVLSPEDVEFSDIRSDYGACSTIIGDYFLEMGLKIPSKIATALMIGINVDTSSLTRGVNQKDLEIYFKCYENANIDYVDYVIRNYICINDLEYYKYLIDNAEYFQNIAICYFENGCSQNLLGILGDFLLSLEEIDFVILLAKNENKINISIRNEKLEWQAADIIRELLKGIGFGGGHRDMAGGVINKISVFNKNEIVDKLKKILNI